jgi:hypothetical protein
VDLSGIIFVALFLAWAVYLIPKAVKHHDEVSTSRSIDRFSHTMRVLARREPVSTRDARLVVTPSRASAPVVEAKPARPTAAQARARREAARRAARRRRRVLGLLLFANAVVITVAALHYVGWAGESIPAGFVVAWLVACRLMVKKERAVAAPVRTVRVVDSARDADPQQDDVLEVERNDQGFDELSPLSDTASIPALAADGSPLWDPLPMTLPTYVTKPTASRSVRTIDLDDTGVWTSGRTEADAALARQADADRKSDRAKNAPRRRAVGD